MAYRYGKDEENDFIIGTADGDHMFGWGGNDTMSGGAGTDWLFGGWGNDTLSGGSWSDYLYGQEGNDTLVGGAQRDFLSGGSGSDTFRFWRGDSGDSNDLSTADVIWHFRYWEGDRIDLSFTNVSYFGGQDTTPEVNEVSYWRYNNETVVSFNDRGQIHDILLDNFSQNMISTDFIL